MFFMIKQLACKVSGQDAYRVIVTGFSASVNRDDEAIAVYGVGKKRRENSGRGNKTKTEMMPRRRRTDGVGDGRI